MGSKKLNFDRTLVLRICDERLQARIREKMAAVEDEVDKEESMKLNQQQKQQQSSRTASDSVFQHHALAQNSSNGTQKKESSKLFDLAGVTVEPAIISGSNSTSDPTLWNFICDGATYPARLTNLPCPVELHKTHDHAMYYKCIDIAQMLIVYEDMTALEEAESMPGYKIEGFPSFYHSGLTPPTSRIVSKRFKARYEDRAIRAIPPPYHEIQQVEKEILELMDSISTKDSGGKTKKNPKPALNKVFEEVEEVIVPYEPWMDDYGRKPDGIEFDEDQDICKLHPELWLDPSELQSEEEEDEASNNKANMNSSSARSKKKESTSTKKDKNLTPDAPFSIGSTKPKKNKASTTKKKKTKKKTTKSAPESTTPNPLLSITPVQDAAGASVNDLDAIDLDNFDMESGLDVLEGLDGLGGFEGLDNLADDDLLL